MEGTSCLLESLLIFILNRRPQNKDGQIFFALEYLNNKQFQITHIRLNGIGTPTSEWKKNT